MTSLSKPDSRTRSKRSRAKRGHSHHDGRWRRIAGQFSPNLRAIALLWVATLLLGGSSRPDVIQIVLLRPLAILVAAFGFWTLKWPHISRHRFLAGMAVTIILLVLLHLVPLPPSAWTALPGRELIVELDREMGLAGVWRPITMAPSFTWNALFSLSVPLAFLVNGVQLTREELSRLVVLVIAGGIMSAVLALFQMFGAPNGSLHFYFTRMIRPEAVGFFANRNHQALLIAAMFPLLAAYGAKRGIDPNDDRRRFIVALGVSAFLIALLIVTGSRAGLVAGLCGLAATPFIYLQGARVRRSKQAPRMWWKYLLGLAFVLSIAGLSIATDRSGAIRRVVDTYSEQDQRYQFWSAIIANYDRFMPMGSGIGSYQPVYQTFEPPSALAATYSNHAHNDWLEVIMTAGIPGGLLLAAAIIAFAWAVLRHFRARERGPVAAYRLAGLTIILLIAMASLVDYPVRAPIIAALLVISCLWAGTNSRGPALSGGEGDISPG